MTNSSELRALAAKEFGAFEAWPQVRAFWWPRFERVFDWFLTFDRERRDQAMSTLIETSGKIEWQAPAGSFLLRGRADRLELGKQGVSIIDFKTGAVPQIGEVRAGFSPQLTLEAAMIARGAFDGMQGRPNELLYVKLSGNDPPAFEQILKPEKGETLDDLVEAAWRGVQGVIARFDDEANGYASLATSKHRLRYEDYEHLARLKEWGLVDGEGEE